MTLVTVLLLATYNHALIGAAPDQTTATPWLVESEPFEPVAPCNQGGYHIHTGFDINGNDVLDEGERQDTTAICHGLRGLSGPQGQAGDSGEHAPIQLVSTEAISLQNSTCPEGGMMMHSGLDHNENDVLDEDEVVVAAGSALLRRRHSALRDGVEVAERHDADDAANLTAADVDALAQPKRTQRVVTTSLGMVATRRHRAIVGQRHDAKISHRAHGNSEGETRDL